MTPDIRDNCDIRDRQDTEGTEGTDSRRYYREPSPDRIVKPRKRRAASPLPIISAHGPDVFLERTGETVPMADLGKAIVTEPASILVAHNVALIVADLNREFIDHPLWQLRASPVEREIYGLDRTRKKIKQTDTVFAFFGWRTERIGERRNASNGTPSRYFLPLDPLLFVRQTVHEIRGGGYPLLELFEWARDVREFAQTNGLALKPTSGGLAAQLLRDPRFYPEPRRKIPKIDNRKARDRLPGNHYRLNCKTNEFHAASYLDQVNAHHSCARDLEFPDANSLYAKGRFGRPDDDRVWCKLGSRRYRKVIAEHGLLYAKVWIPNLPQGSFPPPFMDKPGDHLVYIWTNELPDFFGLGGRIDHLIAAWTSPDRDAGLNRYARWAQRELEGQPETRRRWLKPLLLSTYGILAAKPRRLEFAFKQARGGRLKQYPVGGGTIELTVKVADREVEMRTTNVIHRGMIEAETRARSLRLARELSAAGVNVLAVYADSVFVESGAPLPLLQDPWRVKEHLDGLHFLNEVSFISRQMTKLPGVPREHRDLIALKRHIAGGAQTPRKLGRKPRRSVRVP